MSKVLDKKLDRLASTTNELLELLETEVDTGKRNAHKSQIKDNVIEMERLKVIFDVMNRHLKGCNCNCKDTKIITKKKSK